MKIVAFKVEDGDIILLLKKFKFLMPKGIKNKQIYTESIYRIKNKNHYVILF